MSSKAAENAFYGLIASQLCTISIYPLELAKTRLQASSSKTEVQFDGLGDVLHAIYEEQGIKGFYVGINGELFQQALMQTTYFYFYDLFQSKVRNQGGEGQNYSVQLKIQQDCASLNDDLKLSYIKAIAKAAGVPEGCITLRESATNSDNVELTCAFPLAVSDSDPTGVKNLFNEDFQKRLGDTVGNSIRSIENSVKESELSFIQKTCCGLTAGAITVFIMLPTGSILTRMQTRTLKAPDANLGMIGTGQYLVSNNGAGSLYNGLSPALILTLNPALFNVCFDKLKRWWLRMCNKENLTALEAFILGCIAKFTATIVTYPYILAKTRLMTVDDRTGKRLFTSQAQVISETIATEGVLGLYKGILAQSTKSVISGALLLMFKEKIPTYLKLLRNKLAKQI